MKDLAHCRLPSPLWAEVRSACRGLLVLLGTPFLAWGGFYVGSVSPGNVPWPGGVIPYEFDATLSAAPDTT